MPGSSALAFAEDLLGKGGNRDLPMAIVDSQKSAAQLSLVAIEPLQLERMVGMHRGYTPAEVASGGTCPQPKRWGYCLGLEGRPIWSMNVAQRDIQHQAIGQLPGFVDDGLQIGAIRVCGQYAAAAEVQEEEPAGRRCVSRLCVYRCGTYRAHVTNLLANVSIWSRQSAKPSTCAHRSPTPIWNRFPTRPIHTPQFLDPVQRRLARLLSAEQLIYRADEGRYIFLSQDEKAARESSAAVG